jgi:hypothetical protein
MMIGIVQHDRTCGMGSIASGTLAISGLRASDDISRLTAIFARR